jgi:osmotically-inducible protein OsmY
MRHSRRRGQWGGLCRSWPPVFGEERETDAGTDQSVEDSQLATRVREAIAADRQLQSQDIDVETEDGAVKLTGVVDSTSLRERAVELTGRIDGVVEVTDKLEVRN